MKRSALFIGLSALCLCAHGAAPVRWTAETSRPASVDIPVYQGETVWLEPTFTSYGAALALTNCTATLWYQTNGMDRLWWSAPAAAVTSVTGRVRAAFGPTNDVGAARYSFFIRLDSGGDATYRALGSLVMRPSPGFVPNSLPLPAVSIDFSSVAALNAPWLTVAGWNTASNALSAALQSLSSSVSNLNVNAVEYEPGKIRLYLVR